jgi:hypothetical protein
MWKTKAEAARLRRMALLVDDARAISIMSQLF